MDVSLYVVGLHGDLCPPEDAGTPFQYEAESLRQMQVTLQGFKAVRGYIS